MFENFIQEIVKEDVLHFISKIVKNNFEIILEICLRAIQKKGLLQKRIFELILEFKFYFKKCIEDIFKIYLKIVEIF